MKLDIEAMAIEADMEEAVPGLFYASDIGLLRFASLIVERCAVAAADAEDSRESASMAIRNLLED